MWENLDTVRREFVHRLILSIVYQQLSVQWTTLIQSNVAQVENSAPLGYYAASSGNFLRMVWDNLSVSSSRVKNPKHPSNYQCIINQTSTVLFFMAEA
jgi:hypothetical protein